MVSLTAGWQSASQLVISRIKPQLILNGGRKWLMAYAPIGAKGIYIYNT